MSFTQTCMFCLTTLSTDTSIQNRWQMKEYGELVEWYWARKKKTAVLEDEDCPNAILSTASLIWTDVGLNLCLLGGRPAWAMARPSVWLAQQSPLSRLLETEGNKILRNVANNSPNYKAQHRIRIFAERKERKKSLSKGNVPYTVLSNFNVLLF